MVRSTGTLQWRRARDLTIVLALCTTAVVATTNTSRAGATSAPGPQDAAAASAPAAGMAATPTGQGYWIARTDGTVSAHGDALDHGSMGGAVLSQPLVGIASSASGKGYWLVARDGGIFSYGDARFFGSTGDIRLNQPIVGMAATPSGNGYWMVARDGGIFAFGDARFFGSTGDIRLNQPILAMTASPTGAGYRLIAADGGIFSYGDATFHGSTGGSPLPAPIVGAAPTVTGAGYWLLGGDGSVYNFGNAPYLGGTAGTGTGAIGIIRTTAGYWVVAADGTVVQFPAQGSVPGASGSPTPALPGAAGTVIAPVAQPGTPSGGIYNYMRLNDDASPARYNPCQEIHITTNLASAPATARQDVMGALTRVANATGITFVYDGDTAERPSKARPLYDNARYGDRWVPILIAWVRPGETDQNLTGGILGLGGSTAVKEQGRWVYVTGQVTLNADYNASFGAGFGTGYTWGEVLIHEITHVMGLHHADDVKEIMYPTATANAAEFGPGDRTGLYNLGRPAGCLAQPDPWWLRTAGGGFTTAAAPPETGSDEAEGGIWNATATPPVVTAATGSATASVSGFPGASGFAVACAV